MYLSRTEIMPKEMVVRYLASFLASRPPTLGRVSQTQLTIFLNAGPFGLTLFYGIHSGDHDSTPRVGPAAKVMMSQYKIRILELALTYSSRHFLTLQDSRVAGL